MRETHRYGGLSFLILKIMVHYNKHLYYGKEIIPEYGFRAGTNDHIKLDPVEHG
jgi:hypothetical protein